MSEDDPKGPAANIVDIGPPKTLTEAPMMFADACVHVSSLNSVFRMAFVQNFGVPTDMPDSGWNARHVLSVAMPITALPGLVSNLQGMLNDLRTNGWLPADGE